MRCAIIFVLKCFVLKSGTIANGRRGEPMSVLFFCSYLFFKPCLHVSVLTATVVEIFNSCDSISMYATKATVSRHA